MDKTQPRFLALDVLRGITVCFMIIVNTPGNIATTWAPLLHANWHGFTPTDLVFPTFMFVVGNALSFAYKKWDTLNSGQIFFKILKRSLIIFILGYLMYWFPFVHWNAQGNLELSLISQTRVMGVLQRIALGYFFAALLLAFLKEKTVYIIVAIILIAYWILQLAFGTGTDPYDMLTNAGTRFDLWLMGESHLYHGEGVAFDPEGIFSTLPSIVNVIAGYAAGKWMQKMGKTWEGLTKLLLIGGVAISAALLWNMFLPINKKLWTSSYVLLTIGIDCILLATLAYITDFLHHIKWTYFFQVFGKNPLFIYLVSELGATLLWFFRVGEKKESLYTWLYHHFFKYAGNYFGSFLFAFTIMLLCWLVGYWMDKKKIYIRV